MAPCHLNGHVPLWAQQCAAQRMVALLLLLLLTSAAAVAAAAAGTAAPNRWTVLVYMLADNDLEQYALLDLEVRADVPLP